MVCFSYFRVFNDNLKILQTHNILIGYGGISKRRDKLKTNNKGHITCLGIESTAL